MTRSIPSPPPRSAIRVLLPGRDVHARSQPVIPAHAASQATPTAGPIRTSARRFGAVPPTMERPPLLCTDPNALVVVPEPTDTFIDHAITVLPWREVRPETFWEDFTFNVGRAMVLNMRRRGAPSPVTTHDVWMARLGVGWNDGHPVVANVNTIVRRLDQCYERLGVPEKQRIRFAVVIRATDGSTQTLPVGAPLPPGYQPVLGMAKEELFHAQLQDLVIILGGHQSGDPRYQDPINSTIAYMEHDLAHATAFLDEPRLSTCMATSLGRVGPFDLTRVFRFHTALESACIIPNEHKPAVAHALRSMLNIPDDIDLTALSEEQVEAYFKDAPAWQAHLPAVQQLVHSHILSLGGASRDPVSRNRTSFSIQHAIAADLTLVSGDPRAYFYVRRSVFLLLQLLAIDIADWFAPLTNDAALPKGHPLVHLARTLAREAVAAYENHVSIPVPRDTPKASRTSGFSLSNLWRWAMRKRKG